MSFLLASFPTHGSLSELDELAGTVVYTPELGYIGSDSFTFMANDEELSSEEATIDVYVNGAPAFLSVPEEQSMLAGTELGPLTITIGDPDDGAATLQVTARSNRQDLVVDDNLAIVGTGAARDLTVTSSPDTAGVVTIALELGDGVSSDTATFDLHVGVTNNLDSSDAPGSLRNLLGIAESEEVITFDPDRFNPGASIEERTITLGSELVIDRSLTIRGPGQDELTLNGNEAVRVIRVSGAVVVDISDLTIANGTSGTTGGGIFNAGSEILLSRCSITSNSAGLSGGGIANGGRLTLLESVVSENYSGSNGGGVSNGDGAQLTVLASTLSGNHSDGSGGGISTFQLSELTVLNSTVARNSAAADGGGVFASAGETVIRSSTLWDNRADEDEDGSGVGGGIHNVSGDFALFGSLVTANQRGSVDSPVADDITNNTSLAGDSSFNLIGDSSSADVLIDGENGNIVGVDWLEVLQPFLADNGGHTPTVALLSEGVAVDAYSVEACVDGEGAPLLFDQRSMPRPVGDACDIGAFERQPEDP